MNLLERKRRHYENLKKRLEKTKRSEAAAKHEMSLAERKLRTKKVIAAGRIFEEAGILDDYDHDQALTALKALKK